MGTAGVKAVEVCVARRFFKVLSGSGVAAATRGDGGGFASAPPVERAASRGAGRAGGLPAALPPSLGGGSGGASPASEPLTEPVSL